MCFVVKKAAPAEDAFAEILAGQAKRGAQRRQLFIHLAGEHGRDHAVGRTIRVGLAGRHLHQAAQFARHEIMHAFLVARRNGEIAIGHGDVMVAQMLAHQEGVQRRHRVQKTQHAQVALHVFGGVIARLFQGLDKAALVNEERAAAGAQIIQVEGNDDLGHHRTGGVEEVCLVRADAVLENERGVEDGRGEKRLGAMLGRFAVDARHLAQIEHAAGRGAAQRLEESDSTVSGHKSPGNMGGNMGWI